MLYSRNIRQITWNIYDIVRKEDREFTGDDFFMNPKLQWLSNKMSSLDLQVLIVSNPINIRYLTNI